MTEATHELISFTGEIFDPTSRTWVLVPAAGGPPADGSLDSLESKMVVLKNGTVQTTGGSTDYFTDSFAISQSWIFTPKPRRR